MFDILLVRAMVVDGNGTPPRRADVGIRGSRIVCVGDAGNAPARVRIDLSRPAAGKTDAPFLLCPGFIDVHSHSDAYLLIEPSAPSKIFQGITTEIVGNCGASAAPIRTREQLPSDWSDKTYPGEWRSVAEYRRLLEAARPAPNVVLLTGHNTLRKNAMGFEARPSTATEQARMQRLLEESLDAGSRGFSTGLMYPPGCSAARGEIEILARVTGGRAGVYTSHMRSEGQGILRAIDETLAVGRAGGVRTQISHLKVSGARNWPLLDEALERIRTARDRGMAVAADRYPYTSSCTDLDSRLPAWAQAGGRKAVLARLRDRTTRNRIRDELEHTTDIADWDTVTVATTAHADTRAFRGCALSRVAERLGVVPVDALLYLLERDEMRTSAFFEGMSGANMRRILSEPYVMLGTDASLRAPTGPLGADHPHPRAYGAFPRFLRMAMQATTVSLSEAVRKITRLAADHFGLERRGRIEPGYAADLVVLDAGQVRDRSTFAEPHALASGVRHLIVNGVFTIRDAGLTDRRAGRIL